MADCVFCKIIKGEVSAHVVWEDEKHIAFLTIFPNTEGVTVVATKKHLPSYAFENSDEVLSELILATKKVGLMLDKTFDDVGRCGMFLEGFGVDHLHSKLFPMHGTGDMGKWAPIESGIPEVFFDKYPGYLSSHNGKRMGDANLARTAEKIKRVSRRK